MRVTQDIREEDRERRGRAQNRSPKKKMGVVSCVVEEVAELHVMLYTNIPK